MIFVSPDESGRVTKLNVREGDAVKVGEQLYSVDDDLQQAELYQNNASLANAQQTFDRASSLSKTGSGTQASLDSAVSALRVAEARVNSSQTRLARRKGFAPVAGTIQQIYFREGEMVPEKRPVLSIMPPGNMKIRFFVPETELPKLAIGDEVKVTCDNCSADLTAKIYFIATTAEYTPPVIYSLDERNKLVYLIQARPARPDALRVGQPISVYLNAPDAGGGQAMNSVSPSRPRHRHRCQGADEVVRRPHGRAEPVDAGQARLDLRLPRPQRLGQDHDHPHALRAADARQRHRHLPRLRHPPRRRQDQAAGRLHDAALLAVPGPLGAREPRIRRAALRHARSRATPRAT